MKLRLFTTARDTATRLSRLTATVLVLVIFVTAPACLAQANSVANQMATATAVPHPKKVLTPKHVSVNKKLPKFKPPTQTITFSAKPTDAEIFSQQLFVEPLLPIGGQTTVSENQALATALTAFAQRKIRDDFSSLENFLASNPKSAWQISLLMDLGALYRQTGWYSKSMDAWQQAWTLGQTAQGVTVKGKAIIDRTLTELLVMNARVGRKDTLARLLKAADERHPAGSTKERVESAKQALVLMNTQPDTSFRCGPMAVEKIRNIEDHNDKTKWNVKSDVSTQEGTSLAQLTKLASKLSLDMIPAYRTPGSAILVPSVINWKVGHFAAAVGIENGLVHLSDPTFDKDVWISPAALDAEASGYFLVRRQNLPSGWKEVDAQEAAKVWGKGQATGSDGTCDSNKDCKSCNEQAALDGGNPGLSSFVQANPLLTETDSALSSSPLIYNYVGNTPRLTSINYPNGQSTSYSYQPGPNQDFRLADLTNFKSGTTVLSKFDYNYNTNGTIATWQQQTDSNTPTLWTYRYDNADQLLSAVRTNTSTQAILSQYVHGYDLAGNRTSEQIGLGVTTTTFKNTNEIYSTSGGGPLQFTGVLSKPGTVTVGGNAATVNSTNNYFSGFVTVGTGTTTVPIVANDYEGNSVTNKYQVVVPANSSTSPSYDFNGNLISNGTGQTYTWDAKDELILITQGSNTYQFGYDGLGRRVSETDNGTLSKQWVWVGNRMAEERNSIGAVTKRFFALGEQVSGISYYLTRDHLGSVRELTNASGVTQARYDYDPYGVATLVSGTNLSDFQYAGMYCHSATGLSLTKYRAYDSNTGRWLSRDPLGEGRDATLYSYTWNDPINLVDSLGLAGGKTLYDPTHPPTPTGTGVDQALAPYVLSTLAITLAAPVAAETWLSLFVTGARLAPPAALLANAINGQEGGSCGGTGQTGQIVSSNVRKFMNGDISLSQLTPQEIQDAIKGYQNASNMANDPITAAFQQARINALNSNGPLPGTLNQFKQTYVPPPPPTPPQPD